MSKNEENAGLTDGMKWYNYLSVLAGILRKSITKSFFSLQVQNRVNRLLKKALALNRYR